MTARSGIAAALLVWSCFVTPSVAGRSATIEPGLWAYSADTFLIGVRKGEQCVGPDQVDTFLTGPSNRHYHCAYPSREIGDGRISFSGDCLDKGGRHRYHLVVHGEYKPEAFALNGKISGSFFGLALSVPMSIQAHRVAATCPERR